GESPHRRYSPRADATAEPRASRRSGEIPEPTVTVGMGEAAVWIRASETMPPCPVGACAGGGFALGGRSRARDESAFMRRALRLAERGGGRVSPNPLVGALVVRGGRVIGEGWHKALGAPHAEAMALERAGARARGATLFVTLEPCAHVG